MTESTAAVAKKRDIVTVVIAATIALVLGVNLFMLIDDGGEPELHGEQAPDFELPVMEQEGETVALSELRGQVVLMDFWATWCPPCRDQMPELEAIADDQELAGEVAVLSINTDPRTDERHDKIEQFLEEEDLELPTLLDDGTVQAAYRAATIPMLVVIDPQGEVVYSGGGVHEVPRLRELIDKARN